MWADIETVQTDHANAAFLQASQLFLDLSRTTGLGDNHPIGRDGTDLRWIQNLPAAPVSTDLGWSVVTNADNTHIGGIESMKNQFGQIAAAV